MCIVLDRLLITFYCATIVFTSLLFFFRTRAVFNTFPWVVAFFACLWLAVLGACLALMIDSFEPMPMVPGSESSICIDSGINSFLAAVNIIPLINDTLVFLAISWRLSRNSYDQTLRVQGGMIRLLIFADYLPVFSKGLLRDGQAYYLLALS
jgi:hypothetical protein